MSTYTVALWYTGEGGDDHPSDRLYVAIGVKVEALAKPDHYLACKEAVKLAKAEAAKAYGRRTKPEHFAMLCIFEGKHDPLYFGFQAGFGR